MSSTSTATTLLLLVLAGAGVWAGITYGSWSGVMLTLLSCSVVSLVTWALPVVYANCLCWRPQNLRRKYGAKWALVTGGSSGIGKALVDRLAAQGLNIIIAAIDDPVMAAAVKDVRSRFPDITVKGVGVNLGATDPEVYMKPLRDATAGIVVQVVFCNAGFVTTGFFGDVSFGRNMANYHCNATCAVHISHYFLNAMRSAGKRGAIAFTSSPGGFMPTPFTIMYGATKAFLTTFGSTLAAEVRHEGIDVLVMHPSPTNTRFYNVEHKFGALEMFRKTATTPDHVAATMLASLGRIVVRDQGYFALSMRLLLKVVDIVFITELMARFAHLSAEFKLYGRKPTVNDEDAVGSGADSDAGFESDK